MDRNGFRSNLLVCCAVMCIQFSAVAGFVTEPLESSDYTAICRLSEFLGMDAVTSIEIPCSLLSSEVSGLWTTDCYTPLNFHFFIPVSVSDNGMDLMDTSAQSFAGVISGITLPAGH